MSAVNKHKTHKTSPVVFIVRLGMPLLWASTMFCLSLTSSPPQIPGVLGWDKLLHAGAYGLLTVLIVQFLFYLPFNTGNPWWGAGLFAIGYGTLLEILQLLSGTGRTAEWWDLFADAVGILLAYVMFRHFPGLCRSRRESQDKGLG